MKFSLTTTITALLASAVIANAEEVRVYNWSDYIDEALLAKFEEETGIVGKTLDLVHVESSSRLALSAWAIR